MAAAVVDYAKVLTTVPFVVGEWKLSALTDSQEEVLSFPSGAPTGVAPDLVFFTNRVIPTAADYAVTGYWTDSDASADTIDVQFLIETGVTDTTAHTVSVFAVWFNQASGGTTVS